MTVGYLGLGVLTKTHTEITLVWVGYAFKTLINLNCWGLFLPINGLPETGNCLGGVKLEETGFALDVLFLIGVSRLPKRTYAGWHLTEVERFIGVSVVFVHTVNNWLGRILVEHLKDVIDGSKLLLTALVEAHDMNECDMAIGEGARVIGVNNRNLRDFTVDPTNCLRLRDYVGDKALFVAESGVRSREEIEILERAGVDAVLIGESMMRAADKTAFLKSLKGLA